MDKNTSSSGLGLSSVLTIIFVVLKLVGVIDWSWWWVFSPILIDIGLTVIIVGAYVAYVMHESKKSNPTLYAKKDRKGKWKF